MIGYARQNFVPRAKPFKGTLFIEKAPSQGRRSRTTYTSAQQLRSVSSFAIEAPRDSHSALLPHDRTSFKAATIVCLCSPCLLMLEPYASSMCHYSWSPDMCRFCFCFALILPCSNSCCISLKLYRFGNGPSLKRILGHLVKSLFYIAKQ